MSVRKRMALAGLLARIGLVVFAVLEIHHLHGAKVWLAVLGELVAFLAIGYLDSDITLAKLRQESDR